MLRADYLPLWEDIYSEISDMDEDYLSRARGLYWALQQDTDEYNSLSEEEKEQLKRNIFGDAPVSEDVDNLDFRKRDFIKNVVLPNEEIPSNERISVRDSYFGEETSLGKLGRSLGYTAANEIPKAVVNLTNLLTLGNTPESFKKTILETPESIGTEWAQEEYPAVDTTEKLIAGAGAAIPSLESFIIETLPAMAVPGGQGIGARALKDAITFALPALERGLGGEYSNEESVPEIATAREMLKSAAFGGLFGATGGLASKVGVNKIPLINQMNRRPSITIGEGGEKIVKALPTQPYSIFDGGDYLRNAIKAKLAQGAAGGAVGALQAAASGGNDEQILGAALELGVLGAALGRPEFKTVAGPDPIYRDFARVHQQIGATQAEYAANLKAIQALAAGNGISTERMLRIIGARDAESFKDFQEMMRTTEGVDPLMIEKESGKPVDTLGVNRPVEGMREAIERGDARTPAFQRILDRYMAKNAVWEYGKGEPTLPPNAPVAAQLAVSLGEIPSANVDGRNTAQWAAGGPHTLLHEFIHSWYRTHTKEQRAELRAKTPDLNENQFEEKLVETTIARLAERNKTPELLEGYSKKGYPVPQADPRLADAVDKMLQPADATRGVYAAGGPEFNLPSRPTSTGVPAWGNVPGRLRGVRERVAAARTQQPQQPPVDAEWARRLLEIPDITLGRQAETPLLPGGDTARFPLVTTQERPRTQQETELFVRTLGETVGGNVAEQILRTAGKAGLDFTDTSALSSFLVGLRKKYGIELDSLFEQAGLERVEFAGENRPGMPETRASTRVEGGRGGPATVRIWKGATLNDIKNEVWKVVLRRRTPEQKKNLERIFGVKKGKWTRAQLEQLANSESLTDLMNPDVKRDYPTGEDTTSLFSTGRKIAEEAYEHASDFLESEGRTQSAEEIRRIEPEIELLNSVGWASVPTARIADLGAIKQFVFDARDKLRSIEVSLKERYIPEVAQVAATMHTRYGPNSPNYIKHRDRLVDAMNSYLGILSMSGQMLNYGRHGVSDSVRKGGMKAATAADPLSGPDAKRAISETVDEIAETGRYFTVEQAEEMLYHVKRGADVGRLMKIQEEMIKTPRINKHLRKPANIFDKGFETWASGLFSGGSVPIATTSNIHMAAWRAFVKTPMAIALDSTIGRVYGGWARSTSDSEFRAQWRGFTTGVLRAMVIAGDTLKYEWNLESPDMKKSWYSSTIGRALPKTKLIAAGERAAEKLAQRGEQAFGTGTYDWSAPVFGSERDFSVRWERGPQGTAGGPTRTIEDLAGTKARPLEGRYGQFVRNPNTFLSIADRMAKAIVASMELQKVAQFKAEQMAKRGVIPDTPDAIDKKAIEIARNPENYPDVIETAKNAGEIETLTRDFGDMGKKFEAIRESGEWYSYLLKTFLPVVKTPVNSLSYATNLTPWGIIRAVTDMAKLEAVREGRNWDEMSGLKKIISEPQKGKDRTPDTPEVAKAREYFRKRHMRGQPTEPLTARRESLENLGQSLVGLILGTGIFHLAKSGIFTGSEPEDPGEKNAYYASGMQPFSFKNPISYAFGNPKEKGKNDWISYRRMEPFASLIGMAADAARVSEKEDIGQKAEFIFKSVKTNLFDKAFMSGVEDFSQLYSSPERSFGNWYRTFSPTLMPFSSALGYASRTIDPTIREVPALAAPFAKIPGVSLAFPAKFGTTGDEMTRNDAALPMNILTKLFSPAYDVSSKKIDPVAAEMFRLSAEEGMPTVMPRLIDIQRYENKQAEKEKRAPVKFSTQHIEAFATEYRAATATAQRLIQSPMWARLDDETKAKRLSDLYKSARERARLRVRFLVRRAN